MERGRWKKIEELYNAARRREEPERGEFLQEVCAGDDNLRSELEGLLGKEQAAPGFLEPPALEMAAQEQSPMIDSPSRAGQKMGSYQVLSLLRRGGMGEVYLAQDRRLDRKVALKFLRPEMQQDKTARLRFLREAKSAAALDHPFICKIYEIGETDQTVFIAMEYIEGETLAERMSQGPLAERMVLEWAEEIAEALEAAQQRRIVHRDLKPSNIMLTPEGHAKVTDFGLAKKIPSMSDNVTPTESGDSLSRPGAILGTPAYMSPEQLRGQDIDSRSDIFSFGIVLYEMLTGKHPFLKRTAVETAHSILTDEPDLNSLQTRPVLHHMVRKMLSKDRGARYQQAGEIRRDLQELSQGLSAIPQAPASRRFALPFLLVAVPVLALAAWLWVNRLSPPEPALAEGASILITDLDNQTGDGGLDGVHELLRNQLQQSAYFEVADPNRIREVLNRMVRPPDQVLDLPTAREVAWREGIPLIVRASLSSIGSSYLLGVELETIAEDPQFREKGWGRTFNAVDKDALFEAVDEASRWIRQTAGETALDLTERDVPVREATTSSWMALDHYSRAEKLKDQDHSEDAVLLLKEAVKVDPQFALAHMRIGDILISLGRYREGYDYWTRAQEASNSRRLTKREELRIKALYALDTGDFEAAERQLKIFSLHYPNDYYPFFFHAFALRALGREEEAIRQFLEAEKRWPSLYYIPVQLSKTFLLIGDFEGARRQIETLHRLEQAEWADFMEAGSSFLQGDYGTSRERLAALSSLTDGDWRSSASSVTAYVAGERGKYRTAMETLQASIAEAGENPEKTARRADKLLALGYLRYRLADLEGCREACLEAINADSSPQRLQRAGTLLARSGFAAEATKLMSYLDPFPDVPVAQAARKRISGEVLSAQGKDEEALRELEEADSLEPAYAARDYLARALNQAGRSQEAFQIYQEIQRSPGRFWLYPHEEFPGTWADSVGELAEVAWSLGKYCEALHSLRLYLGVRREADAGLDPIRQARARLKEIESRKLCPLVN